MLSWFRMSILFGWNPLTVSRLVYSSVLQIMSLVRQFLTLPCQLSFKDLNAKCLFP